MQRNLNKIHKTELFYHLKLRRYVVLELDRRLIRMTLGSIDRVSLKEARSMLPSLHKLVASGIDPRNARAAVQAENTQAVTMQSLFDTWIEFVKLTSTITPAWIKRHEDRSTVQILDEPTIKYPKWLHSDICAYVQKQIDNSLKFALI